MTGEQLRIKLGKRIRFMRRYKDITQKNLSKKLGFSPSHLCEIEKGKKSPSIKVLHDMEQILGEIWIAK